MGVKQAGGVFGSFFSYPLFSTRSVGLLFGSFWFVFGSQPFVFSNFSGSFFKITSFLSHSSQKSAERQLFLVQPPLLFAAKLPVVYGQTASPSSGSSAIRAVGRNRSQTGHKATMLGSFCQAKSLWATTAISRRPSAPSAAGKATVFAVPRNACTMLSWKILKEELL